MRRHVYTTVLLTASFMFLIKVSGTQAFSARAPYRVGTEQRMMFDVVPTCVKEGVQILDPVHLRNCPCFVSFGLSTKTQSQVEVDFLVFTNEKFTEWRSSRYSGAPDYIPEFSAVGSRANEYNMVYDKFFFQTPNIELYRNETFVMAIRTRSDEDDCELEIMHIFQSMPLPCPVRLRSGRDGKWNQTNRVQFDSSSVTSDDNKYKEYLGLPPETEKLNKTTTALRIHSTEEYIASAQTTRGSMKIRADSNDDSWTGKEKGVYSKTDHYTSTNNVVAGTEVSDLTIRLYMVSIRSSSGACSGTVIGPRWILTAAHCQVREGGEALIGGNTNLNGASYRVKRFIAHPDYTLSLAGQVEANDIAVIETDSMKHGRPVLLNFNEKGPDPGRFVRASGYGQVAEDWISAIERTLLQVDIPIVSFKRCVQAFASYGAPEFARALQSRSHLCAGYADDDCAGDTCYGDSGGPIVVRAKGKYVQVGVVSGGIGCARKGLPGFYTRVGQYWQWIQNVTNGEARGFGVHGDDSADAVNESDFVDGKRSVLGLAALPTLGIIAGAVGLGVIVSVSAALIIKRIGREVAERMPRQHMGEVQGNGASMDNLLQFKKEGKGSGNTNVARETNAEDEGHEDNEIEDSDSEFQRPTYSKTGSSV
ncbi:unnamed protein product [Agarophyton chilense]